MYLQSVCITSCMDRQRTPRRMNETLEYQKGEPDWFPSPARGNITYTTPVPEAVCNVRGHPLRPLSRLRRIQSKHVPPPGQSQLQRPSKSEAATNREDALEATLMPTLMFILYCKTAKLLLNTVVYPVHSKLMSRITVFRCPPQNHV